MGCEGTGAWLGAECGTIPISSAHRFGHLQVQPQLSVHRRDELVCALPDEPIVMKDGGGGPWRPLDVSHRAGGSSLLILLLPHPSPKQKSLDLCCQQKEGCMRFGLNVLVWLKVPGDWLSMCFPTKKTTPQKKQ